MRRALVVGINDYTWGPLKGCINDANNIADAIQTDFNGKTNFHVTKLTSDEMEVTEAQLMRDVHELFEQEAEVALFFFSGHGADTDIGGYLVTQDAEKHDLGASLNEIIHIANNAKHIKEIIIIIDACYAGHAGNTNPLTEDVATLRRGVSVLASSKQDQYSKEKNGQGVFTSIVVEAIMGGGADVLGHVTVAGIYDYVDKALGPWEQRPVFKSYVTELNSVKSVKPRIPLDKLRKLDQYFEHANSPYPLSPAYEPTAEPRDKEKEAIFSFLQKCRANNVVEPIDEEHMYWAAMHSTGCRLTAVGKLYWRMVTKNKV